MTYSKLFSKRIPLENIVDGIKKAITIIYALPVEQYNSSIFHDLAIGFKSLVSNMEEGTACAFPLFLKWLKLYVKLQHQIGPKNKNLSSKFEKKIPVCTSYIVAALQYQTKMLNYHLQVMEMCLSLFNSASSEVMKIIANLDIELIALLWMPVEFVGDYNTQKIALKLIVKVLQHLNDSERRKKITEIDTSQEVRNLIFKLTTNGAYFEKISRELLNHFNMKTTKNCAVFSIYCTTALFGSFELFKPEKVDRLWIDFNYTSKSVSFLCQLKQSVRDQEELSIQIKIDKLQIENQFDCIVLSIEPAIFSTEVSTELKNNRIAVFTLPQNEVERLKANRDLVDFYNKSYNHSYSESDAVPTPNTIENYLAEGNPMEDDFLESPGCCLLEEVHPELSANSVSKENSKRISAKKNSKAFGLRKSSQPTQSTVPEKVVSKKSLLSKTEISQKKSPKQPPSRKESGYSTCMSTVKQDSTIFKKPTKPVRQKRKQDKPNNETIKAVQKVPSLSKTVQNSKSSLKPEEKNQPTSQSTQSISGNSSRRFFKSSPTKQTVTPPPKKTKRSYRRKTIKASNTGISPKRKQVNTVKPLDHLTKPDCDPEEAALEYVENGGYANIITFLRSNVGVSHFSEQQRQQILANIEIINEDLERSTHRFFQKGGTSDTDSSSIWKKNKKRRKGNTAAKNDEVANFVPYSMWKEKQKEKTSGQSTMLSVKQGQEKNKPVPDKPKASLNAFDQLKVSSSESNGGSCSKPTTSKRKRSASKITIADNRSSASSASSCSNHNFLIAESDNELMEETAEEIMPLDMICRREPEDMEICSISVPIEASPRKTESRSKQTRSPSVSQASITSDGLDVIFQINSSPSVRNTTAKRPSSYQMSEIFEELEEIPAQCGSQHQAQSMSSDSELEQSQPLSVHSSNSSQQTRIQSSQAIPLTNSTSIPRDVHTQSEQNQQPTSTWYIEKFLREQQNYNEPPFNSHISATCFDTTPEINENQPHSDHRQQNITTNQVIIQNQFVVSTTRKRTIPAESEDSPLAKIPSGGDCVPLKGYSQLLPSYIKQVSTEKDRLLKELEQKLQEDFFDNFTEIADEVMKSMIEHETAINEAQEQLSSIYGKLEWLIENQQKNKSQLENIYYQLIGRIKASLPRKEELNQAYDEVADQLKNYATNVSGQLWQKYANGVVDSIEDRLRDLVHL